MSLTKYSISQLDCILIFVIYYKEGGFAGGRVRAAVEVNARLGSLKITEKKGSLFDAKEGLLTPGPWNVRLFPDGSNSDGKNTGYGYVKYVPGTVSSGSAIYHWNKSR